MCPIKTSYFIFSIYINYNIHILYYTTVVISMFYVIGSEAVVQDRAVGCWNIFRHIPPLYFHQNHILQRDIIPEKNKKKIHEKIIYFLYL